MAGRLGVVLRGAPSLPASALAFRLKEALALQRTPLLIRRGDDVLLALLADERDYAIVQRAESVTLFGVVVVVVLSAQSAAVVQGSPVVSPLPPVGQQHAEILAEYGAIAARAVPFTSMGSSPAEWGYSPEFLARTLRGSSEDIDKLLMVACGGGCPLALVPHSAPLVRADMLSAWYIHAGD